MRTFSPAAIALVLAGAIAAPAAAQPTRGPHATVTLLAERTSIPVNGVPAWLGVRFALADGWHIYWQNPGESGTAPAVRWTVPSALQVGDLSWPVPERLTDASGTTYVYRHDVVLLAPIHRAGSEVFTNPVTIRATVSYMICREVCVKETAAPTIQMRIASTATRSADAPVFEEARANIPKPMPAAWTATMSASGAALALAIDTGRRETSGSFFPVTPRVIDDAALPRIEPRATGLTLHLAKSSAFQAPPAAFDGLLVLPDAAYLVRARWQ